MRGKVNQIALHKFIGRKGNPSWIQKLSHIAVIIRL